MPRPLVVGNGEMLITFDAGLNMRDLYYPYVGQWNHIQGNKNSLGVWVEGQFSWVDESGWERSLKYRKETLVTCVELVNKKLQLSITINDAVHYHDNIYIKRVVLKNTANRTREIRLFFNHDLSIDETEVGDTAVYEPEPAPGVLYHYKKAKYFLINGISNKGGIYQYATGTKRFAGAEGTWRDAEDGHLQGNPIAQGSVDSTISLKSEVEPFGQDTLYYWLTAGHNFKEVKSLDDYVSAKHPGSLMASVDAYWKQWVNKTECEAAGIPRDIIGLYKRSLLIIRTQVDNRGAILAANDSDILQYNRDHYSYCWPRDGALVSSALIHAGYPEIAAAFFRFCEDALTPGGFLLHKYNPDGSLGSSWHPWIHKGKPQLPIQEDETGLVLFTLWEYYKKTKDIEFVLNLYRSLISPAGNFMAEFILDEYSLPCESYDLWEERRGIFTFTASAVYGGLTAAANFALLFADYHGADVFKSAAEKIKEGILTHLYDKSLNRFLRGVHIGENGQLYKDLSLESSVFGVYRFGVLSPDDERVISTMKMLESGLWVKTPIGGMARYTGDFYFRSSDDTSVVPGNPWFICTLWLAEWYIDRAKSSEDLKRPLEILNWVTSNAVSSGVLPEQIHPYTGEPLSVAPLTWSHSEYVLTVKKLMEKVKEFN